MNVDTRARESAAALREASRTVATGEGFEALVRTRRRRTAERTVAAVACLALAATALTLGLRGRDAPQPADPSTAGTIVSDLSGSGTTGVIGFDRGGQVDVLSSLAHGTDLVNPSDLSTTSDGATLALVGGNRLQLVDVRTETLRADIPCRACTGVSWMYDDLQLHVMSTRPGKDPVTQVYQPDGTLLGQTVDIPGVGLTGFSPDGDRVVGVERVVGQEDRQRLFVQDAQGGGRYLLKDTLTQPGWSIGHVSWAPRGDLVGYVLRSPVSGTEAKRSYQLNVARVDATAASPVADLGRCVCLHDTEPAFAWSPDGGALAAQLADTETLLVVRPDGTVEGETPGAAPVDWIAAE